MGIPTMPLGNITIVDSNVLYRFVEIPPVNPNTFPLKEHCHMCPTVNILEWRHNTLEALFLLKFNHENNVESKLNTIGIQFSEYHLRTYYLSARVVDIKSETMCNLKGNKFNYNKQFLQTFEKEKMPYRRKSSVHPLMTISMSNRKRDVSDATRSYVGSLSADAYEASKFFHYNCNDDN